MTIDNNTTWYMIDTDGQEIIIPLEEWAWQVKYNDGTTLNQFELTADKDNKALYHRIGEVDMKNVKIFEMVNTKDITKRYSIVKSDDMTSFIHLYRRTVLNVHTSLEKHITMYIFGYVINDTPIYHYILPDSRLVITTERNYSLIKT